MEIVAMVTVVSLLQYAVFALLVTSARKRTGIVAPQVSGHPEFERYFRVQQNTLERLVIFIPALWIFSTFADAKIGACLGGLFIVARALYCAAYVIDPQKRGVGYVLGEVANTVLMLGGLGGAAYSHFVG